MQNCTKYRLFNDDPLDVHYLSHVDGSLHVLDDGPFDNNNYCIENLKMGDDIEVSYIRICRFSFYKIFAISFSYLPLCALENLPKLVFTTTQSDWLFRLYSYG